MKSDDGPQPCGGIEGEQNPVNRERSGENVSAAIIEKRSKR